MRGALLTVAVACASLPLLSCLPQARERAELEEAVDAQGSAAEDGGGFSGSYLNGACADNNDGGLWGTRAVDAVPPAVAGCAALCTSAGKLSCLLSCPELSDIPESCRQCVAAKTRVCMNEKCEKLCSNGAPPGGCTVCVSKNCGAATALCRQPKS